MKAYSSVIQNSQNVQAIPNVCHQMNEKQKVVCLANGVLLSRRKKGWNLDMYLNTGNFEKTY